MSNGCGDMAMRQAGSTIGIYLDEAVKFIDGTFGQGYAKAHPKLVAVFIQACVKDFEMALTTCQNEARMEASYD